VSPLSFSVDALRGSTCDQSAALRRFLFDRDRKEIRRIPRTRLEPTRIARTPLPTRPAGGRTSPWSVETSSHFAIYFRPPANRATRSALGHLGWTDRVNRILIKRKRPLIDSETCRVAIADYFESNRIVERQVSSDTSLPFPVICDFTRFDLLRFIHQPSSFFLSFYSFFDSVHLEDSTDATDAICRSADQADHVFLRKKLFYWTSNVVRHISVRSNRVVRTAGRLEADENRCHAERIESYLVSRIIVIKDHWITDYDESSKWDGSLVRYRDKIAMTRTRKIGHRFRRRRLP